MKIIHSNLKSYAHIRKNKEVNTMTKQVCCIGELLIDIFSTDVNVSLKDAENFKRKAGGAPANVAAMVANLGGRASMIGKIGDDSFGEFLIETLKQYKVDTSMVKKDEELPTTIAFVSRDADGERDFQFNRGADQNLKQQDLLLHQIWESSLFHFGSATALLEGTLQRTYLDLMHDAKTKNKFVSFDPNYREDLWKENKQTFIKRSKEAISKADFVKASVEELLMISEEEDLYKGIAKLHDFGAKIVVVTMGKDGSIVSDGQRQELIPSKNVKAVDTTGAGDAFVGAALYQFSKKLDEGKSIIDGDFDYLREVIHFANGAGAAVCTKVGSLTALPSIEEI